MTRPHSGPYARQHKNPTVRIGQGSAIPDRAVKKAPYRLEMLKPDAAGWVLLAGYLALDPALRAAEEKKGIVRVVRTRRDGTIVIVKAWRNGRVVEELEDRT